MLYYCPGRILTCMVAFGRMPLSSMLAKQQHYLYYFTYYPVDVKNLILNHN